MSTGQTDVAIMSEQDGLASGHVPTGGPTPLSGKILAYASGSFGKSTVIGALELTSLFYLTDLIGVSPGWAGSALFAVQLANAAMDAAVGQALDRWNLQPYRAGSFIVLGSGLAFLAFSSLYALPILHSHNAVAAISLILAARLAISLMEGPHNSLLVRLAPDSQLRTKVSAYRFGFSTLSILLLSSIAGLVMDRSASAPVERNILLFGILCGVLGPAGISWSWWRIRDIDRGTRQIRAVGQLRAPFSLAAYFGHMRPMWHRDYIILLLVTAATPFCTQLFLKSVMYEALYVLHNRGAVQLLLPAMMSGQILGVFIWTRTPATLEKAHAASLSFVIIATGFVAFYLLARTGLWPGIGSAAVIGIGVSGATSLIGSMSADCCDLARSRGRRTFDATAIGTLSCVGKISSGLCALALGWGLALVGYLPDVAMSPVVTSAIHAVSSLIPTAAALACAIALLGYKLSYAFHEAISLPPIGTGPT